MKLGMQVGLGPGHIVLDGYPAPAKKGAQPPGPQFSAHVYCGQTAGWIKMPLGTEVGLGSLVIFTAAIAVANWIVQSPMASCSRRGHSVLQASADRNLENSERRGCGLSAGKRWWECRERAKSDIYSCLVSSVADLRELGTSEFGTRTGERRWLEYVEQTDDTDWMKPLFMVALCNRADHNIFIL